jgi:hypothetical protein
MADLPSSIDAFDLSSVVTEHGRVLGLIHAVKSTLPTSWPPELEQYRDPSVPLDLSGGELSQVVRLRMFDVVEQLADVLVSDRSRYAEALATLLTEASSSE